jgi:hypothetical protein
MGITNRKVEGQIVGEGWYKRRAMHTAGVGCKGSAPFKLQCCFARMKKDGGLTTYRAKAEDTQNLKIRVESCGDFQGARLKHDTPPSQGSVMKALVAGWPSTSTKTNCSPLSKNISSRRFSGGNKRSGWRPRQCRGTTVPDRNAADRWLPPESHSRVREIR